MPILAIGLGKVAVFVVFKIIPVKISRPLRGARRFISTSESRAAADDVRHKASGAVHRRFRNPGPCAPVLSAANMSLDAISRLLRRMRPSNPGPRSLLKIPSIKVNTGGMGSARRATQRWRGIEGSALWQRLRDGMLMVPFRFLMPRLTVVWAWVFKTGKSITASLSSTSC